METQVVPPSGVASWSSCCTRAAARRARQRKSGGEYGAGWKNIGKGRVLTTFFPEDMKKNKPEVIDGREVTEEETAIVVYDNALDNVEDLAHIFFTRCLEANVVPSVVTKKTVFKWQEGFWQKMKKVFDADYKQKHLAAGLLDSCGGELVHHISDAATMQIIRWTGDGFGMACHNYDGDMLTDEVAQVHRSPGKRSRCTHPALALQAGYHRDASGKSELEEPKRLNLLQRLIHHPLFDNFFASAILMNALFIAAQTEFLARRAGGPPSPSADLAFNVIDKIFAAAFAIEFVLRLAALRCGFFVGAGCCWNVFDMLLVIMSGVEVVMQLSGLDSQGPEADASAGKVMRMFRMARIIRIMRVLRFLDELRIMVLLILHSVRSLFWLMVLLCIILFVFSIFFTQGAADFLDGPDPELMGPTLDKYYGSLANSALTLFTAITGGVSWREVMEPLSYAGWLFTALFILYVSFCVFSVLNIVTGVFVDGAIQRSAQERDLRLEKEREQKQEYISMLMDLLTEIDTDQTGVITRGALEDAFQREQVKYTFSVLDIDIHDSNYLFDMLDLDRSGEVDTEEFVLGCLRLKGNAKSIDIHTLMFEVKHMLQKWDLLMSEESDKREAGPGHDES